MKKTENEIKHLVLVFCISLSQKLIAQPLYFSIPQESVEIKTQLLIQDDCETLSKYYFVKYSDQQLIDSLKDGSYFIRDKKPDLIHPAASRRYKKPFDPNFKYLGYFVEEDARIKVDVSMEMDQGNGMIQRGISSFYLIKSDHGYQLSL